jgi:metal-responsive CopG/Arc/MetJ family transcriptional regulator
MLQKSMARKIQVKKGEEMQKMMVSIPPDLYRQLRHYCVEANTTQSETVTEALRRYLGAKGGEKEKK